MADNKRTLKSAAEAGDTETVIDLLDRGVPICTKDDEGMSLLHWAAWGGHVTTMRLLIRRGCDVDAVDGRGLTPLHWAAALGQTKTVRELIRNNATKSVVAGNCGTPLHLAAFNGHVETVVAMLEEECPNDAVDSDRQTVLHAAVQGGHVEVVRKLVGRGCNVNAVETIGCTPLHYAAAGGCTEVVLELIKLGATKSVVAGKSGTPLQRATFEGHVKTVVAMLEERGLIDIVDSDGSTVLHTAAQGGHTEVVRELVDRGCDVNAVDGDGCTPLHSAATNGRTGVVCELLKRGATMTVTGGSYGTPLHQAVMNGHLEIVQAFLENQFNKPDLTQCDVIPSKSEVSKSNVLGACNSASQTPVMWAVRSGQVETLKLLASKSGALRDRDTHSVSTFEHCFVGGHASKLSQFCEACSIGSSGEGLRGALANLISSGLVDARKVLCLCAISGDSIFLEHDCMDLLLSDYCRMPTAMRCAKYCFSKDEGVPLLSQLAIPDENALNPLQISLISLKCFEMGFATQSVIRGTKDHTTFITKLLSCPGLKETVNDYFPNGLSPLDLARQFELHDISALIEGAGGRPGVWADVPQSIEVKHSLALAQLKEAYAVIKTIAEDSEQGLLFIKTVFSSVIQQPMWHSNAATVGADVGAETDDHEYKSLMDYIDGVSQPLNTLHGLHERVNKATYTKV